MHEATHSQFPHIEWIDASNYCEKIKIPDKNVNLAAIDRIFIATNVELQALDENPDKMLCRYEFYEYIVRLAQIKYKDSKICSTFTESVKKIIEENVLPYSLPDKWQEFRDE